VFGEWAGATVIVQYLVAGKEQPAVTPLDHWSTRTGCCQGRRVAAGGHLIEADHAYVIVPPNEFVAESELIAEESLELGRERAQFFLALRQSAELHARPVLEQVFARRP